VSAFLSVHPHPCGGLSVQGCDEDGHQISIRIETTTAWDLASQLDNVAMRVAGRPFVDNREPRDDSECMREVERT